MTLAPVKWVLDRLYSLADAQAAYFTTSQAEELGVDRRYLSHHVRSGNLERVDRGVYRLLNYPNHPMRPHDLRHPHVARSSPREKTPYMISQRLSRASIHTAYDVYGHLSEGRDREAGDALEKARSRSLAGAPQVSAKRAVVSIEL